MTSWRPIVAFLVLLTSCTSVSVSQEPGASASLLATESPSLSAIPTAASTPDPTPEPLFAPDDIAMVVTNDLVLRSAPGTGPDSEIYRGLLNQPTLLFVVGGPISASGYEWFQVHPFSIANDDMSSTWRLGWVAAAAKDGEPWIAPGAVECEDEPRIEMLIDMSAIARLACYGDRQLSFGASYEGPTAIVPSAASPSWLTGFGYVLEPMGCVFECGEATPPPVFSPFLFAHRRNSGVAPEDFFGHQVHTDVHVTGHFDHRVSSTCRAGPPPGESVGPPVEETILMCRTQFVVTDATGVTH